MSEQRREQFLLVRGQLQNKIDSYDGEDDILELPVVPEGVVLTNNQKSHLKLYGTKKQLKVGEIKNLQKGKFMDHREAILKAIAENESAVVNGKKRDLKNQRKEKESDEE